MPPPALRIPRVKPQYLCTSVPQYPYLSQYSCSHNLHSTLLLSDTRSIDTDKYLDNQGLLLSTYLFFTFGFICVGINKKVYFISRKSHVSELKIKWQFSWNFLSSSICWKSLSGLRQIGTIWQLFCLPSNIIWSPRFLPPRWRQSIEETSSHFSSRQQSREAGAEDEASVRSGTSVITLECIDKRRRGQSTK